MFDKFRTKISDFFNRIPAVIIIPLVLMVAFGIAAFLIWAGIEMSPVTERVAEDLFAEKASVPNSQNGSSSSGKSGSNLQAVPVGENKDSGGLGNQGSGAGEYNVYRADTDKSASRSGSSSGSAGGSGSGSTDGSQSSTGSPSAGTSGNASADTGQGNNQFSGSGNFADTNSNSNQNSSSDNQECYHPSGDVKKWWHNATPKQKECYISQHGEPDLGREVPYFCAYNNSEDCYYR